MDKIRVLLVDDHSVVRTGLAITVARDMAPEVVGKAGDGVEAIQVGSEAEAGRGAHGLASANDGRHSGHQGNQEGAPRRGYHHPLRLRR